MSEKENKKPSEADIKEWKAKHKEVHVIEATLPNDDKVYQAYIRKPKMKDMEHALAMRTKKGDIQMMKTLYENCVLWEDQEIRNSDELYMGVITQMNEVVTFADASIKKL